mmetsp:Transcript_17151/g.29220  ORF Transcript_17151/g.29220 Transcript_17151/m.29220 type:complete len:93 (+) Transcript_17151:397-675(+)
MRWQLGPSFFEWGLLRRVFIRAGLRWTAQMMGPGVKIVKKIRAPERAFLTSQGRNQSKRKRKAPVLISSALLKAGADVDALFRVGKATHGAM